MCATICHSVEVHRDDEEEDGYLLLSPLSEKEETKKNGSEIPSLAFSAYVAGCGGVGACRGREGKL